MTPYEDKTYKDHIKEEKSKLKSMSLKDKIWYIWEYYKFPILGILIAVFAVSSIGSALYNNRFDTAFSCVVLNSKYSSDQLPLDSFINKGFREYIGLDENTRLDVDYSMNLTFDEARMTQYSYAEMAKLTAIISSKGLDVMIGNEETAEHYGAMSGFSDLKQVLPPELYESVKDRLFITKNEETGEETACGVYLDADLFLADTGLILEKPVFSIMSNTPHTDASVSFLRYLLHQ